MSGRDTSRTARAWVIVAAAFLALLAFVPSVHGGFAYDDHRFYEDNVQLGEPSILVRAFSDPSCQTSDGTHAGLWRPLRTLSFAADRAVFGPGSAAGPHAVNVLLHAAGTAALAALLLAWGSGAVPAALGAAVYAVHPAQAECVAWISSRGDLLAAVFTWCALLAALRDRPGPAACLGAAALLSKEQAVVWPLLAVLSARLAGRDLAASLRAGRVPAAVTVAFLAVRHVVLTEPFQEGGLGAEVGTRQIASVLGHQAWFAVTGVGSLFDWQMPPGVHPFAATAAALGVVALLFVRGARVPAAWFLAALVPTVFVQAFVPLNILVADRFLQFALPALALGVASAATAAPRLRTPCAIAALAFGVTSVSLVPVWRDDVSLWTRTAKRAPRLDPARRPHWRANAWLGDHALREGRFEDAERYLTMAARAATGDPKTRYRLAVAQEVLGKRLRDDLRVHEALANYQAAILGFAAPRAEGADELLPVARWAEADLLLVTGRLDEARARIEALLAEPGVHAFASTRRAVDERRRLLSVAVRQHMDAALADRILAAGDGR